MLPKGRIWEASLGGAIGDKMQGKGAGQKSPRGAKPPPPSARTHWDFLGCGP